MLQNEQFYFMQYQRVAYGRSCSRVFRPHGVTMRAESPSIYREIGKRKRETLLTESTIPVEHISNLNVTEPYSASLSY